MNFNSHNLETIQTPQEGQVMRRPEFMSEAYYERNLFDPFRVAEGEQRGRIIQYSSGQIEPALNHGKTAEAVEFGLDALYRSLPLESAASTKERIQRVASLIERRLNGRIGETERLSLQMKMIDLGGLQIFRDYQAKSEVGNSSAEKSALATLEATCTTQVINGALLLKRAQRIHESMHDPEDRKDLRGKMFELLFITNERRKLLKDDDKNRVNTYYKKVLVSATGFEDSPSIKFSPNHNYDAMAFDESGNISDMYQCKNGQSNETYAYPIKLAHGKAFGRFIEDPKKYIDAILLLAKNPYDVPEETMVKGEKLIEDLFDPHPSTANRVGDLALR